MKLELIKNDRPRVRKDHLYLKAYEKILDRYNNNLDQELKPIIKKLTFYGVGAINGAHLNMEPVEWRFRFADTVKGFMATLTPKEFINIFPIMKEFDGKRMEMKDFFSTMEYINELKQDEPIGDQILDFLWEYHNIHIRLFTVRLMSLMSDLRRAAGYPGIMEEWAAENEIETYTMHTDGDGKKFMVGSDGSTARVKPRIPKYLRVVQ